MTMRVTETPAPPDAPPGPTVPCPTCRAPAPFAKALNPWRPFCSERCRQRDFGAWASESFRVPAVEPPDDQGSP